MKVDLPALTDSYDTFVFDFDGVIKDSVPAKSNSFELLFSSYPDVIPRIVAHHLSNGGIPRSEKIPLYMSWCGIDLTPSNITNYITEFSSIVVSLVVDSPYVPGIFNYLEYLSSRSKFLYILSATPQQELQDIVSSLSLSFYFQPDNIIGHPSPKSAVLQSLSTSSSVIFFGDSFSDYKASITSSTDFVFCFTNPSIDSSNISASSIPNFL